MKYILQIFTGPWHKAYYQPEEIIRKIREISCRIPVDKVIIGWNTDPSVYKTIGAFLHKAGTEMLLWLPVFAETGEVTEPEEALDLYGKRIESPANDEGADLTECSWTG